LPDPVHEVLDRLVSEPSRQDRGIAPMISDAKLAD
jgi:hypothetical protein